MTTLSKEDIAAVVDVVIYRLDSTNSEAIERQLDFIEKDLTDALTSAFCAPSEICCGGLTPEACVCCGDTSCGTMNGKKFCANCAFEAMGSNYMTIDPKRFADRGRIVEANSGREPTADFVPYDEVLSTLKENEQEMRRSLLENFGVNPDLLKVDAPGSIAAGATSKQVYVPFDITNTVPTDPTPGDVFVPEILLRELVSYFVGSGRDNSRSDAEIREVASGMAMDLPSVSTTILTRDDFMQMVDDELDSDE